LPTFNLLSEDAQDPGGLPPDWRMRRMNDIASSPPPMIRRIKACQISGLKIGPITCEVPLTIST